MSDKYTPDGRPFSPGDRYQMYMRGWRDGAGGRIERHKGYPDYDAGYSSGRTDASYASQVATKRTGYSPSILRAGEQDDTACTCLAEGEPSDRHSVACPSFRGNSLCARCGQPNPIAGPYCNRPSCGQKG